MDAIRGGIPRTNFAATGDFLSGRLRSRLSADDLQAIEDLVEKIDDFEPGARLVSRNDKAGQCRILNSGFAFRTIEDDGERFITGLFVPGDFVDLHCLSLGSLDHNVDAAGPVKVGVIEQGALREAIAERPGVAQAMWHATLLDAAIHRKGIQVLEQLDAPRRIAHVYSELQTRLDMIGRDVSRTLRTPFTQFDLADMCGVSAIHANRAVGKLRDLGLGEIRRGDFYTSDWQAVKDFARFDPAYLYGETA